jgi:NAD(P)-dependent dehydrogenase (short-subunit alcohol dehydrogenase family)
LKRGARRKMSRFEGMRGLVTGAGSGIGREVALGLARGGARKLILTDLNGEALEQLSEELSGGSDAQVSAVIGDAGDEGSWLEVRQAAEATGLNAIVNNAGIAQIAGIEETSLDDWRRVVDVNLTSIYLCAKHLFPLTRSGGSVVNVASVAALVGQSRTPAYIASKGGAVALTRGLAVDYAHRRIRVNAVCPGPTDTPLLRRHFELLGDAEAVREQLESRIPLGRLLAPADVAPLILFLCSGEARMITGATFVVDGGLSATFDYGAGLVRAEDEA